MSEQSAPSPTVVADGGPVPAPPVTSLAHLLPWRSAQTPSGTAYRYRDENGAWADETWREVTDRAHRFAAALIEIGLQPGECVAIVSATRYEWLWCDLGVISAAGVTTSVYPTSLATDVHHILRDSRARIAVAEGSAQIDVIRSLRQELPDLTHVISLDGSRDEEWLIPLEDVLEHGRTALAADPHRVERCYEDLGHDDVASLLYTSGTTGKAKGVVLTHGGWLATLESLEALDLFREDDVNLLWLPLAHAFGKLLALVAVRGGFLTVVDGDVNRISANLAEVRPTFMCAVPRVLEKIYAKVRTDAASSPVKERLLTWATAAANTTNERAAAGRPLRIHRVAQRKAADALVLRRIRAAFGGRIRFLVSGSAPLDPLIARWFAGVGLTVLEGYGLTESGATATINRVGDIEFGTVGKPLAGNQIALAEDGEILVRSAAVMREYLGNDAASRETVTADGWLLTGDVGTLTERGNVRITDRKKNVLKTANGKYVAPGVIETRFMAVCPYAAQFVVVGESRPYVVALVSLDPEAIGVWANEHSLGHLGFAELMRREEVRALTQGYVDELNRGLNRWEQIKTFALLERELTIEAGDLTPSMKLRRKAVEKSFVDTVDQQYR